MFFSTEEPIVDDSDTEKDFYVHDLDAVPPETRILTPNTSHGLMELAQGGSLSALPAGSVVTLRPVRARLKGRLQLHKFLLGTRWSYLAGVVGLVIGIVTAIAAPPVDMAGIAIAVLSTVLGIATFVHDSREITEQGASMHALDLGARATDGLRASDLYHGFEIAELDGQRVLISDEINALLAASRTPLAIAPAPYRLMGAERTCAAFVLREHFRTGAVLFNDRKVRLASDVTPQALRSGRPVTIQRTDYFSSLCTNEIATREIRYRGQDQPILRGRDLLSSNDVIADLVASRCSNHIGVSTLAFSRDGHLILATQTSRSAQSPNRITASGSGSVDWSDVDDLDPPELEELVRRAMDRELVEETGIAPEAVASTTLTGYVRVLGRGGKPEFFGISLVDVNVAELQIRRQERLFIADVAPLRVDRNSAAAVADALAALERERGGGFALSLTLALELLRRRLRVEPDATMSLIRGEQAAAPTR